MPQASNITINNGAATPVPVTFAVAKVNPEMSVFADRASGIPQGFPTLTVSTRIETGPVSRTAFTVTLPTLVVVDGKTTVARILRAKVEYILPNDSTDAERKDLDAFVRNGLVHANVQKPMRDLDPNY